MRHIAVALVLLAAPVAASAQPSLLFGGGLTSPTGDFSDVADPGYHVTLGVQVGVPTIPVGIRLDGSYHRMPEPNASFQAPRVLGGALDVVFDFPGVGLTPYALVGVGRYRVTAGPAGTTRVIRNGFQGGFGVSLGALAFGAFAEIRLVVIDGDAGDLRYVPLSIGLRM